MIPASGSKAVHQVRLEQAEAAIEMDAVERLIEFQPKHGLISLDPIGASSSPAAAGGVTAARVVCSTLVGGHVARSVAGKW